WLGFAMLTAAVGCLVLMTSWGGSQYPWGSATIIGLGIGAVALAAAFMWWEQRVEDPLIPPRLFRSRVFDVANATGFIVGVAVFGAIFAARLTSGLGNLPAGVADRVGASGGSVQVRPEQVQALPAGVRDDFLSLFVHALHGAFMWGAIFAVLAFVMSWML